MVIGTDTYAYMWCWYVCMYPCSSDVHFYRSRDVCCILSEEKTSTHEMFQCIKMLGTTDCGANLISDQDDRLTIMSIIFNDPEWRCQMNTNIYYSERERDR